MANDDKTAGKKSERDARLAAALRQNLQRRKAQARARDGAAEPPAGEGGDCVPDDGRNSS